ncbi:MAG: ribonuclease P protein component [Pseudomonadota bacterium]
MTDDASHSDHLKNHEPRPRFDPMSRLVRRSDFLRLAKGRKAVTSGFVLQALRRPADVTDQVDGGTVRTGYTTSRKVGSAVERNRVRRRLKAAMSTVAPQRARANHDYVLVGRRQALTLPFEDLIEDLDRAFIKVHTSKRPRHDQTRHRDGTQA